MQEVVAQSSATSNHIHNQPQVHLPSPSFARSITGDELHNTQSLDTGTNKVDKAHIPFQTLYSQAMKRARPGGGLGWRDSTLVQTADDRPNIQGWRPQDSRYTSLHSDIHAWRIQDYNSRDNGSGTARRVRLDMEEMKAYMASTAQNGLSAFEILSTLHQDHERIINDNLDATQHTLLAVHVARQRLTGRILGRKPASRNITWFTKPQEKPSDDSILIPARNEAIFEETVDVRGYKSGVSINKRGRQSRVKATPKSRERNASLDTMRIQLPPLSSDLDANATDNDNCYSFSTTMLVNNVDDASDPLANPDTAKAARLATRILLRRFAPQLALDDLVPGLGVADV